MRIRALIISLIAALTIGTMATTNTLLPAVEYAGDLGEEKLTEMKRFARAKMSGPDGRFLENNYTKGDCYPQNMEFTYADTPTAHTVQIRTEGDSILVTDDRGRTHVLAGINPIPKREEYAQRAAELLIRGDHPVTIYLLEEKERHGYTTAVLGLGENQDSLNAKLVMERVARHTRDEGRDYCLTHFDSQRRNGPWLDDPWQMEDISEYGRYLGQYPAHYPNAGE